MGDRISVTRHVEFEAAHMLTGYDGLCRNLHGHSYKMEVTISCPEYDRNKNPFNFVIDFSKLNKVLKEYVPDHSFVVNTSCSGGYVEQSIMRLLEDAHMKVFKMDCSPSAENMVKVFAKELQVIVSDLYPEIECTVDRIDLWETRDSHATWVKGE